MSNPAEMRKQFIGDVLAPQTKQIRANLRAREGRKQSPYYAGRVAYPKIAYDEGFRADKTARADGKVPECLT